MGRGCRNLDWGEANFQSCSDANVE
uniref:Uncharacterized protein n=1 Tax=Arundo donax TaxID=35708 RepID=A0A0A9BHF0_ARUDO